MSGAPYEEQKRKMLIEKEVALSVAESRAIELSKRNILQMQEKMNRTHSLVRDPHRFTKLGTSKNQQKLL